MLVSLRVYAKPYTPESEPIAEGITSQNMEIMKVNDLYVNPSDYIESELSKGNILVLEHNP